MTTPRENILRIFQGESPDWLPVAGHCDPYNQPSRNLLPLYRRTKMDAVHGFTIPPVGDVTVAEGRIGLGDAITILAGVEQLAGPMSDRQAVVRVYIE